MKRLQDNVTIITGGGKGIGFGLASAFAKEGSNLVITGRNEARLLEAKKKLEEGYGVKVLALVADGADEVKIKEVIATLRLPRAFCSALGGELFSVLLPKRWEAL